VTDFIQVIICHTFIKCDRLLLAHVTLHSFCIKFHLNNILNVERGYIVHDIVVPGKSLSDKLIETKLQTI